MIGGSGALVHAAGATGIPTSFDGPLTNPPLTARARIHTVPDDKGAGVINGEPELVIIVATSARPGAVPNSSWYSVGAAPNVGDRHIDVSVDPLRDAWLAVGGPGMPPLLFTVTPTINELGPRPPPPIAWTRK